MNAWRTKKSERGAMAIEFAFVFPIVFVVMFGILEYGVYFWGRSTAAASARESARQLAVGTEWTCSRDGALAKATTAVSGAAVTMRYDNATNSAVVGDFVEVTVTAQTLVPGFWFVPLPDSGAITEVATARVENIPQSPLGCS